MAFPNPYQPSAFHASPNPSPASVTPTAGPASTPRPHYVDYPARRNNAIPLPVPVPNLIKKSRGRRVPADTPSRTGNETRAYVCEVEGCGKCFVRGEHLKRHVRSIHTYEKPHECPYEGCGKSFSRRDNLAQHSRVHLTD
ncbi:hypothetical protein C8R44DRAFT_710361 [Mycena epipterygia]|nr:hypothetical protein C8R44DRAFT_710361 [Mycena epipterygia]